MNIKEYFESLGFYVSDGLKYGVDFLLYTSHPSKVHSKYAVLLDRQQTMFEVVSVQRVCCSVNKQLVFVRVQEGRVELFRIKRSTNTNLNKI